jgi:hypothetical protein
MSNIVLVGNYIVTDQAGRTFQYQTELNRETGSTVTYDVTGLFRKDAVLRNDSQIVNGQKVYNTQLVPDKDGNVPSGPTEKFLLEKVAVESDKQRSSWYLQNGQETGKNLGIPGVRNTANADGSSDTGGSEDINLDQELGSEARNTRNNFSRSLKYPLNLGEDHQDVIKFNMVKFRPRPLTGTGAPSARAAQTIIGTVVLPIPAGISDTNLVNWGSDELEPQNEAIANLVGDTIARGGQGFADAASGTVDAMSENSSGVGELFKGKFTEAITGVNALSRNRGAIANSNMELLFQGTSLRPFSFVFKLSARSERESQAIRTIIRFFKQGMSPIRTQSELFLKSPHTFQMQYLHRGNQHNYLNKFKECALQSISVDYTPEGNYATFTSGAMVSYQISLQFQELEPIFNDDYGLGSGSSGYDSQIGF